MKFSNKIYCFLILILASNFAFSQVPVRRKVKAPLPIVGYSEPSRFFLSTPNPKDSLQVQIYSIVMNAHHLDNDAFDLGKDDYIVTLRKYITESKGLKKGILQFYLANIYLSYIDRYSSRVKSTNITSLEKLPEDYRTWAINDFYREADRLYQEALSNQTELQKQKTAWEPCGF